MPSHYESTNFTGVGVRIEKSLPLLEEILGQWEKDIGKDFLAYKNHVYRVVHFAMALQRSSKEDQEKIIIAGCFHDLGIWTDHPVDYLPSSILLAKNYLRARHLENWIDEIELMIDMHHKLSRFNNNDFPLVEVFRKADVADVSLGTVKWSLSKDYIIKVKETFPNSGFHIRLNQLAVNWIFKHPLNPLPFVKW
jgi:hypothetical protein